MESHQVDDDILAELLAPGQGQGHAPIDALWVVCIDVEHRRPDRLR